MDILSLQRILDFIRTKSALIIQKMNPTVFLHTHKGSQGSADPRALLPASESASDCRSHAPASTPRAFLLPDVYEYHTAPPHRHCVRTSRRDAMPARKQHLRGQEPHGTRTWDISSNQSDSPRVGSMDTQLPRRSIGRSAARPRPRVAFDRRRSRTTARACKRKCKGGQDSRVRVTRSGGGHASVS